MTIGSVANLAECNFWENNSPSGGDILAFNSGVEISKSCFRQSAVMFPVFGDKNSTVMASDLFGSGVVNTNSGDCDGILDESVNSKCFTDDSCNGTCLAFDSPGCPLGEFIVPTSAPFASLPPPIPAPPTPNDVDQSSSSTLSLLTALLCAALAIYS